MTDVTGRYVGQFRPEFSRLYEDHDLYWITPFAAPCVLGVVGIRYSGTSSVIDYLATRHGFRIYNLGAELRRIAEVRGVPVGRRRNLQELGDQVRTEQRDGAFLARRVLRRIRDDSVREPRGALPRGIVIGGIKTDAELRTLASLRAFKAVEVRARYAGTRFRRASESGTLEEEYEADRLFWRTQEQIDDELPQWKALSAAARRRYFDELDRAHGDGHPGNWPPEYRGVPASVIASLENQIILRNDRSLSELHRQIDEHSLIRSAHRLGY